MKIYYDNDLDYAEVFFESEANYADDVNEKTMVFKSEKDERIIGYAFNSASTSVVHSKELKPQQRIAVLTAIGRKRMGLSQEEMSKIVGISYRTYQRIEEGEISKIEDLLLISRVMKDIDFSSTLKNAA